MPTQNAPAVNAENRTLERVRDLARNFLTVEEYESATTTAIVERLVMKLEVATRSNAIMDRDNEDLKNIMGRVTGSLLEVKHVATVLITSRNPDVCLNETLLPDKCRGWKRRAELALQMALPYTPNPEAPSHREPAPEPVITTPTKPRNPIVPASKAVDLSNAKKGGRR